MSKSKAKKPKAPPRPPCQIICFETKRRERAEKEERARRRQAAYAGSLLEDIKPVSS